jgi:uncharacterized phosphosugar-binding protein
LAAEAKDFAKVIGISSFNYKSKQPGTPAASPARVCDLCIDNHVPLGDAAVQVRSDGTQAGPVSSIASIFSLTP